MERDKHLRLTISRVSSHSLNFTLWQRLRETGHGQLAKESEVKLVNPTPPRIERARFLPGPRWLKSNPNSVSPLAHFLGLDVALGGRHFTSCLFFPTFSSFDNTPLMAALYF
jgi:hypothetical protein